MANCTNKDYAMQVLQKLKEHKTDYMSCGIDELLQSSPTKISRKSIVLSLTNKDLAYSLGVHSNSLKAQNVRRTTFDDFENDALIQIYVSAGLIYTGIGNIVKCPACPFIFTPHYNLYTKKSIDSMHRLYQPQCHYHHDSYIDVENNDGAAMALFTLTKFRPIYKYAKKVIVDEYNRALQYFEPYNKKMQGVDARMEASIAMQTEGSSVPVSMMVNLVHNGFYPLTSHNRRWRCCVCGNDIMVTGGMKLPIMLVHLLTAPGCPNLVNVYPTALLNMMSGSNAYSELTDTQTIYLANLQFVQDIKRSLLLAYRINPTYLTPLICSKIFHESILPYDLQQIKKIILATYGKKCLA